MWSARVGGRRLLFDFEYKWEVYTPVHLRRWGYYVLPILYGDDLVARASNSRLDRESGTLNILGFWLEQDAPQDADFADALARGLEALRGHDGGEEDRPGCAEAGQTTQAFEKSGVEVNVEIRTHNAPLARGVVGFRYGMG